MGYKSANNQLYNAALGAATAYAFTKKSKSKMGAKARVATATKAKPKTSRSRTVTKTVRRKGKETMGSLSEYTRNSVSLGRVPKHNLSGAWKLLSQNLCSNIYAYRNYSTFGGASGSLFLENTSTTATTGTLKPPVFLYEMTSAPNVVNGSVQLPLIQWIPLFSDPTATSVLSWSNTQNFTVENSDSAASIVNTYPLGNDTLRWIQAKLLFYAPSTITSRIQIDVIQFKDTRLVPDTANVSTFACAFWQSALKRFTKNPLEPGDSKYQKYFKTLYSDEFIIDPKETTEAVSTRMREKNIFMRLNRRCTYDWQDSDRMGMLTNSEGPVNTDGSISTQVHPRARIFLMIRAQANNAAAASATIHPSFDIVLRTKHEQFSS